MPRNRAHRSRSPADHSGGVPSRHQASPVRSTNMAIQHDTRPSTLDEAEAAVVAPEPASERAALAGPDPNSRPGAPALHASEPGPRRPLPGGEPALLIEHVT